MEEKYKDTNLLLQKIANHLIINSSFLENIGLLHGIMGVIIFFYHYSQYSKNLIYEEIAENLLDDFAGKIHSQLPIDFKNGYLGIGWGIEYLAHQKFINKENINEILEDIDKKVMERDVRRIVDTSLNHGLEGVLHYVLFRLYNNDDITKPFDESYLSALFYTVNSIRMDCLDSNNFHVLIGKYKQWYCQKKIEYDYFTFFSEFCANNKLQCDNIDEWELGIVNGYAGIGLNKIGI